MFKDVFQNRFAIWAVFALSLMMAWIVWLMAERYYERLAESDFLTDVSNNLDSINKRMSRYENALRAGIGFFEGSTFVSREDWHDFVEALDTKIHYPGMQGIGFAKMLRPDEVEPLERKMREEGFGTFTLKPAGKREQYSAILYLEPMDKRNLQAIGYDMFSEQTRRAAMERARDSGLPSASGRVTLVQEIDSDVQAGMLLYFPLYEKGMSTKTVQERRKALIGYVYSPFRMGDLMQKITPEGSEVGFEIYDSGEMNEEHLLYRSFQPGSYTPRHSISKTLDVNGMTWHINFFSTPAFDKAHHNAYPLLIAMGGMAVYVILLLVIVTLLQGRRLLQQQALELRKLSQAAEQNPNSIIITNLAGEIEYVNTAFTTSTGYLSRDVIGKNPRFLQSGKTPSYMYESMWRALASGESWQGEFVNKHKDGTEYVEAVNAAPIIQSDGAITHYMAVKEDITEKKASEERIHRLANYDSLTDLPNRFQLQERIDYTIGMAKRNNGNFAIMFLDIDHFKDINDTLGHTSGDMLLVELAKRFENTLRATDMVSRLGGDEFVFLLPHIDTDYISHVAEKLLGIIEEPFRIELNELIVTASIGIAVYPMDGENAETLSKNADAAMYRAKQEGRNKYCFYTDAMQQRSSRNLMLTNALHHALEREELYLLYQPQVALKEGCIIGAEALLRWRHPEYGEISPAEFIPLAEETGLILPIGEWVLRCAAAQMKKWREGGLPMETVSVNLSAVQFRQSRLSEIVTEVLEGMELAPECLELELTEAVAMHDPKVVLSAMEELHRLGIRLSIDDFGTGYSSLSYLKKFKVYKLKIDQSFIRDISTDPEDKAIVGAVISMGNSLGLRVIAEGVETSEQLEFLHEQGCDEIQGYYYSRPLDAEQFEMYVREFPPGWGSKNRIKTA